MSEFSKVVFGDFNLLCQLTDIPVCGGFSEIYQQDPIYCQVKQSEESLVTPVLGEIVMGFMCLLGALIIAYRIHSKRAAVGRSEMNVMTFWYSVLLTTNVFSKVLRLNNNPSDQGMVIITGQIYLALWVGLFWQLLMNGFVGFQVVEDGSKLSVYGILFSSIAVAAGAGSYFSGLQVLESSVLYSLVFIWPIISMFFYAGLSASLVFKQLSQRKPLIYLFIAAILLLVSVTFSVFFSQELCLSTSSTVQGELIGSLNGAPFGILFGFLSYIMLFKFWSAITEGQYVSLR